MRRSKSLIKEVLLVLFVATLGVGLLSGGVFLSQAFSRNAGNQTPVEALVNISTPTPTPEPDIPALRHYPTARDDKDLPEPEKDFLPPSRPAPPPDGPGIVTTLTISAAGDVTLGGDARWPGYHAFMRVFEANNRDFSYFLRYTRSIFEASDLSIVNLEGTLTYATEHMDLPFVFRAPPSFARILTYGAVDVVTVANNHTPDFFEVGYQDTLAALRAEGIAYFGNDMNTILEVNGIQVGLFGFLMWNDSPQHRADIVNAITDLRQRGAQLIIAYHHWGIMQHNMAADYQRDLGRFTLDSGADLVLGSHPHVIQGIERHDGRFIVHSLADFCYGGHSHPPDQDAFIFQQTFTFIDGVLMQTEDITIIPVMMSSTRAYNNFQPVPADAGDARRIMERLQTYSGWLGSTLYEWMFWIP